jgi:hypothetical protein
MRGEFAKGSHVLSPLESALPNQVYFVRLRTGSSETMLRMVNVSRGSAKRPATPDVLSKNATTADTLQAPPAGYAVKKILP